MRRTIYLQMLYLIDMHKSWIALDGSRSYAPCIIFKRGRVLLCTFRTIRLRAIYKHNGYERGTKWSISEYELDRALAVYRKRNPEVKARLKRERPIWKPKMSMPLWSLPHTACSNWNCQNFHYTNNVDYTIPIHYDLDYH